MWDSVPWFVGGGAEHSPEVARLLAYAALGGAEGVVSPGDLKVVPLDVPGTQVRVSDGAALILNRATGGDQQTYVARNPDYDTVDIASTGSSGGRSDLIVVRIEDPNMAGEPWQQPADPTVGPYVFTRVIPNVPNTTTRLQDVAGYEGDSAYTLARIDIPASTGTITSGMIVDLRHLARPRSQRAVYSVANPKADLIALSSAWQALPSVPVTGIQVPTWATHAVIRMETTIRQTGTGSSYANFQSFFGDGTQDTAHLYCDETIDFPDDVGSRQAFLAVSNGYFPIPSSLRGKTATITSRVKEANNQSRGNIGTSASDYYIADIEFVERVA